MIDLRSDTATRPSEAMRRAMSTAEVGDDWFGEDPTVNRLQELAAEATGKEAALFVASGTMANQIALRVFVRPGHEYVAEATAHMAMTESHAAASLSGVVARRVTGRDGLLDGDLVADALEPDPYATRAVDLVCVENTHQVSGGRVLPLENLDRVRSAAGQAGVPVYMDGARIFNASVASGVAVSDYAARAEAVMFALSKGLGAPVGSLLCGPAVVIEEARRVKLQLGGGWRQAGVLAAAGILALAEGPRRLAEDHENARLLAEGVEEMFPGSVTMPETNIVFVEPGPLGGDASAVAERLAEEGVLASIVMGRLRMLTHLDVSADDVAKAVAAWGRLAR